MILCVYAVVSPPPLRLHLTGIAGERLKVIAVDRLGAVVGALQRAPAPAVRNLRKYAAAIAAIAEKTPAILPARFGTTACDVEEVTFILRSRAAALRGRLRAVRGRSQMTIRLLESESHEARSPSQSAMTRPTRLRLGYKATRGTEYLRQKTADAAVARAVPRFDRIRPAIRRYLKDERVEKRSGVVTINHLVPRGAVDRYRSTVERTADENSVRLIVTGPWPPYAFADTW